MKYYGLTPFFLTNMIIITHIAYLLMIIFLANFLIDSPKYNLDYFGITRLSKNKHFSLCQTLNCLESLFWTIFGDITIVFTLYLQKVIFSNKFMIATFKKRAILDLYYFPKFISQFISCFSIIMSIMLFQPMKYKGHPVIDLSEYVRPIWFYIISFIGFIQISQTLYFHYVKNDDLGGMLVYKMFKHEDIPHINDYPFHSGIFTKIRHPFRGGVIIIMIFINTQWDIGRLIYTCLFIFAMYVEAIAEDKYFYVYFKDKYRKYLHDVNSVFFNVSFISEIISNKKAKTSDNKTEDESKKFDYLDMKIEELAETNEKMKYE